jgi:hypothetical protein
MLQVDIWGRAGGGVREEGGGRQEWLLPAYGLVPGVARHDWLLDGGRRCSGGGADEASEGWPRRGGGLAVPGGWPETWPQERDKGGRQVVRRDSLIGSAGRAAAAANGFGDGRGKVSSGTERKNRLDSNLPPYPFSNKINL